MELVHDPAEDNVLLQGGRGDKDCPALRAHVDRAEGIVVPGFLDAMLAKRVSAGKVNRVAKDFQADGAGELLFQG